jgi:probable phosphoglycerate mutase
MSSHEPGHDFQRPYSLPAGATEIVLVRHGSSARRNVGEEPFELVGGHSDPPLSTIGRLQAGAVCSRLARERLDALFVTTLRRTAETAAPLAESQGLEPLLAADLREVHLGDWEGHFAARVVGGGPLVARVFAEQRWDVIPGAEPMEDFQTRVRVGLEHVLDAVGPDRSAAAFVHGGVIAEACRMVSDCRPLAFLYAENASLTRLVHVREGRWVMRGFNDVAHLEQLDLSAAAP